MRADPAFGAAGAGVEAVLFDVDDTLVDTAGAFAAAIEAVAQEYLPHVGAEEHAEMLALWRADARGYYRRFTRGEITHAEQRRARAAELHEAFGGPPLHDDDDLFARWDARYNEAFAAAWRPFEDALACVREVSGRGLAVGAVTNAQRAMQERKLRRCGLADDVPLLVTLDTFGVGKPDPRVFTEACRLLGTDATATVYVGDELDLDARAARAAGLRGVWLDRPGRRRGGAFAEDPEAARVEGIEVIAGLSELTVLLEP
ncbi:HAD family hydrolase [Pseudactinotalea sp. Z1748]|uniref:HAD family hydrolase n=1 Tax=Pseudactinotalea sp. Z1748 TaxID=3413027 RepID=UPI003C7D80AE